MRAIIAIAFFTFVLSTTITTTLAARFRINRSCKSPRSGTCMNVWKCPFYANLLKKQPRPLFVVKSMQDNLCGFVNESTPKVCCVVKRPSSNDIATHENSILLPLKHCGAILSAGRITEGVNANFGEFPWMALIAYKTGDFPEDEDFKCAGTLINEQYVLTAAHCVDESSILGIRLGEYNIETDLDCDRRNFNCASPVQDLLISGVIVHSGYDPLTFINDIALIRLATPANISTDNVKPICLPFPTLTSDVELSGRFLTVTGWGITETGHKSKILQKISIPVVPMPDCLKLYKSFKPLTRGQICAGGYKGRDSCGGDSGGPLQTVEIMANVARYVQYGIVSYGPTQCGIDGRPAIYTKVQEYLKWILDNIGS